MMVDNQLLEEDDVGGDDEIFVYTGGEQQEVPRDVKRVRIAENIDTIPAETFRDLEELTEVEGHNKLKKIEQFAFYKCTSLRRVKKVTGVIEIEQEAFYHCPALIELEFDKLEIIGCCSFGDCESLRSIKMTSVRMVEEFAFDECKALTDVVFGQDLETTENHAFEGCTALRRIAIPLKHNLIIGNLGFQFCDNLSRVDTLAGEIHTTISSLHLESWRNEMEEEIDRINQTLPNTPSWRHEMQEEIIDKTEAIQEWIERVLGRMEYYKTEHKVLVKEAMTLLELALWKTKLLNEADEKKCSIDVVTKEEHRVTCGASIVIRNVLPFLALK